LEALYFLVHPAIYRLPFARVPERIRHMDPGYLATILDRAVPVFMSFILKLAQTDSFN
jgi:hypothetical protein